MPTNLRNASNASRAAYPGVYEGGSEKKGINFLMQNKFNEMKRQSHGAADSSYNSKPAQMMLPKNSMSGERVLRRSQLEKQQAAVPKKLIIAPKQSAQQQPVVSSRMSNRYPHAATMLEQYENYGLVRDKHDTRVVFSQVRPLKQDSARKLTSMHMSKNDAPNPRPFLTNKVNKTCPRCMKCANLSSANDSRPTQPSTVYERKTERKRVPDIATYSERPRERMRSASDSSCSPKQKNPPKPPKRQPKVQLITQGMQTDEVTDEPFLYHSLKKCGCEHLKVCLYIIEFLKIFSLDPNERLCTCYQERQDHEEEEQDYKEQDDDDDDSAFMNEDAIFIEKAIELIQTTPFEEEEQQEFNEQYYKGNSKVKPVGNCPLLFSAEHVEPDRPSYTEQDLQEIRTKHAAALEALKKKNKNLHSQNSKEEVKEKKKDDHELPFKPLCECERLIMLTDCHRKHLNIYKELNRIRMCTPPPSQAKKIMLRKEELEMEMQMLNKKIRFYSLPCFKNI